MHKAASRAGFFFLIFRASAAPRISFGKTGGVRLLVTRLFFDFRDFRSKKNLRVLRGDDEMALPPRFELGSPASEARILSIEIRERKETAIRLVFSALVKCFSSAFALDRVSGRD